MTISVKAHRLEKRWSIPENDVASLVGFPCMNESNIARQCCLQDVSPSVDFSALFRYTRNSNAILCTTVIVSLRDTAFFDGCGCPCRSEEGRNPSRVCPKSLGESPLRCEFESYLTGEEATLEVLVTGTSRAALSMGVLIILRFIPSRIGSNDLGKLVGVQ